MSDEPARVARLPHTQDSRNFPIPFFVATIDGQPDFRVVAPGRIELCHERRLCWMCGGKLTRRAAFVVGPMCTVNRVSAEPPNHIDCATYAATHCPFLTRPRMVRREARLPETATEPGGIMIKRNPGVTALWVTPRWERVSDGAGGFVFRMGDPTEVRWYAEGRAATRAEVEESIRTGLPALEAACDSGPEPALDRQRLAAQTEDARAYLPPAPAGAAR